MPTERGQRARARIFQGEDGQLVRSALAGKRRAIERFVDRMQCVPRMLHARNMTARKPLTNEELEDLVQDTLAAVWNKLPTYNGTAALETWVHQFCYREFMRYLRAKRRFPSAIEDLPETTEPEAPPAFQAIDYEHVLARLDGLRPNLREILRLKHFEDLTFDQIGLRLGISPNTAKTRYYRGLQELQRRLGERTGDQLARRPF